MIVCGPLDPAPLGGAAPEVLGSISDAVSRLAERLGWPLVAEPASQLRFVRDAGPSLIHCGDLLARSAEVRRALRPELIVRFGQTPTSKALGEWLAEPGLCRTILVDGGGIWQDPYHRADTLVVAEPAQLCRDLHAAVGSEATAGASDPSWLARWREADQQLLTLLSETDESTVLWEAPAVRTLLGVLPEGALLHVASSMPIRDLDSFAAVSRRQLGVLSNRGANGIDGLISTAAGEALAAGRERPTALLCGDLAFLHDIGGLAAASQLPLRLTVVVLDNGGGGIFEYLPIAAHPSAFERRFLTPQTTGISELCAAVGARYERVLSAGALAPALRAALAHDGLAVVHVLIDRAESVARHRTLFARAEQVMAAWLRSR